MDKDKRSREAKKGEEVYNENHPKIEKLNSMFGHLFEKRSKHPPKERDHQGSSKVETMANIASFEETLPL